MISESFRTGLSFGLTSGVITTLGLLVGLSSSTNSKAAVIGGILTIAIADSFSDALGIHVSEESEAQHSQREIWEVTAATFFTKFLITSLFLIPVLTLPLFLAMLISAVIGLVLLGFLSYFIARAQNSRPLSVVGEHVLVGIVVIIASHYVGKWISNIFG